MRTLDDHFIAHNLPIPSKNRLLYLRYQAKVIPRSDRIVRKVALYSDETFQRILTALLHHALSR